jgi:hypothetical protein
MAIFSPVAFIRVSSKYPSRRVVVCVDIVRFPSSKYLPGLHMVSMPPDEKLEVAGAGSEIGVFGL